MTIVVGLLLSVIAAAIPTLLYAWLVWWCDRYEREPWPLIAIAFIWGALPAVLLSAFIELILDIPLSVLLSEPSRELIAAGILAPIIEEPIKGIALVGLFLLASREFDNILDGIVYGALVGFGFAATENLLYFLSTLWERGWMGWLPVVLLRSVVFGFNHALFTSILGVGLGIARLTRWRWLRWTAPLAGLGGAILLHAFHNLGVQLTGRTPLTLLVSLLVDWGGVWVLIGVILLSWHQERGWIREFLADEIIPERDRRAVLSTRFWERIPLLAQVIGLARHPLRQEYYQLLAELAFRKRHLARSGPDPALLQEIEQLRARMRVLQVALHETTQGGTS